jgi:integrase
MRKQLNDEAVRAARPEKGRSQVDVYDTICRGLVLRVSASAKTWAFHFRHEGKFNKITIGNAFTIKVSSARKIANELGEKVRAGVDPRSVTEDAPETFSELTELFLARTRRSTKHADRAMLMGHVIPAIGGRRLIGLDGPTFARLKEKIVAGAREREAINAARLKRAPRDRAGESIADRVIGICTTMLRWAVPLGYVASDFTIGIKRFKKKADSRTRVLEDAEIAAFLKALPDIFVDEQRQIMMQLILLLGCRKGEMIGARIEEFTLDTLAPEWTQPAERVKNRTQHVVPLCLKAIALIERARQIVQQSNRLGGHSDYLFPSPETGKPFEPTAIHKTLQRAFQKGAVRIRDEASGLYVSRQRDAILTMPSFSPHDLRRTAATGMARLGIDLRVIAKCLNHLSANQSVTGLVYDKYDYLKEKRMALTRWAEHLDAIENGADAMSV